MVVELLMEDGALGWPDPTTAAMELGRPTLGELNRAVEAERRGMEGQEDEDMREEKDDREVRKREIKG